ncbi:MAG TPA: DUF3341 domain-containing protein [bacterium]|jgi:hypothetical protein
MAKPFPKLVAIFSDPDDVLHAAAKARDEGWRDLDMITPYPLHGSEKALGLKMSWVPYVTVVMGLLGAIGGYFLQHWTLAIDWKMNIGGKPPVAWQAYVPITFECGILIGGISTFVAMLIAAKLPKRRAVILDERLTNDQFALIVPLDNGMNEESVSQFLSDQGAEEVRHVEV